jgi:metallo-beta-lactamase family protein
VLNGLYNEGRLPKIPIYVDSPLSVNATEVFRLYTDDMNENVRELMHTDPDPFGFNTLHYVSRASESKRLNNSQEPAIIISASGMLEAGRVKHHVANHIEDPSTTILIVGYCTPSSLGARIQEPGLKEISIFGIVHPVRAQIKKIEGFSGHGDYKEMIDYIRENQDPDRVAQVIIVHGEENAQLEYKQHLEDAGFNNIVIPSKGEKIELPNPNAV